MKYSKLTMAFAFCLTMLSINTYGSAFYSSMHSESDEVACFQDWYATTGKTRNAYGVNYSINIRVKGFSLAGGCLNISEVQVSTGGGWSRENYNIVYGEDCTYYVMVGYETYYFTI